MTHHRADIPMPELLGHLAREVTGMAGEIDQLQDTLSEVLCRTNMTPRLLEQAQALDHVLQHLTQLARIMDRAALETQAHWTVRADTILAEVSLSALAHRLSGAAFNPVPSGDMEVF